MADFFGNIARRIGPAGPFPDPDVSEPKPPAAAIAPPVGSPYPAGPYDPKEGVQSPTTIPWERVGGLGLRAFGVDHTDGSSIGTGAGQNASGVAGPASLVGTAYPSKDLAGNRANGFETDWFDAWHVNPGELALGNVLTTQIRELELLNNFRREARTWQGFINNAGAGVSATNLPSLPLVLDSLESFVVDIQVTIAGPPSISGTLDFDIDTAIDFLVVPITGSRITIFPYRPQAPIKETLQFKTDVLEVNDGSEQRINVRENPRQAFQFTVRTDDDRTRDSINAVLYDWQSRVFGIPVWHEQKPLDAPLAINDTTVQVDTSNADFRAGGLVMIYDSDFAQETLEVLTVNPTDIELDVGVGQAFDAVNTIVVPVRTALTKAQLTQARYAIGPTDFKLEFTTLDNVDLASGGAFATYQGVGQTTAKPLIDRENFMKGATVAEGIRRKITRLDPETSAPLQFSPWTKGKPGFAYGFEAKSFLEVWEFRQLLHFLKGSQLAFYVGTGRRDFKPIGDISDTSTQLDVQAFGFTQFVQQVTPRSDLQIHRTDGTTSQHEITGSSEVSSTVERITITPAVTPALPLAELDRIEFLTLNRIANDQAVFSHRRPGESRIDFTLTGVPS